MSIVLFLHDLRLGIECLRSVFNFEQTTSTYARLTMFNEQHKLLIILINTFVRKEIYSQIC
jgi:hypothetical protein